MSAVDVEESVARLEAIIQQQAEQIAALGQRQAEIDPVLLSQQRRGAEAMLDAPLKSMPEGARAMDFRPKSVRMREMALAKMQRVAANRGGVWHPNPKVPSVYGHRGYDSQQPLREPCPLFGSDEFEKPCHRTCWTPETETRFLHALGLKDMATAPVVPLTEKDPTNNRDAMLELVGLLKGSIGGASMADTIGQYPSRDQVATTTAGDVQRKVRAS